MRTVHFSKKLSIAAGSFFTIVVTFVVLLSAGVFAATWTERTASGSRTWTDVACSSDCTKIIAADGTDTSASLYRSTDSGVTWNAVTNGGSAFTKQWKRVASNSDGTKLLASELSGDVYYSTDSGANWTSASLGTASWTGLCISDDGTTMEAIANGTQVGYWYSTNSGSSWTNTAGLDALTPNTIACSSDGSKVVVGMFGNNMYYSSNSGSSWSALTNSQSGFWNGVAMSADGTKLAGVLSFGGDLWTSTDSGANWTDRSGAGTGGGGLWQSVAMSTDGATILGVSTVNVKSSTDSGANWSTESGAGTATWKDVWVSDDGAYWVIGGTSTNIWTAGTPPVSAPTVTASAASSVTTSTATFNGNITSTGNDSPTTRGFHYGTTTGYGTTSSTSGTYSTGAYTASITGLTCNTTYHYEAFATNTGGTGDSSDVSFTTSACPVAPTVITNGGAISGITSATAALEGNITDTGGENATSVYVKYSTDNSYGTTSTATSGSYSTGTFTHRIYGLTAGTTYNYKTCAANSAGEGCGSGSSFTTLAAPDQPTSLAGTAGYTQVALTWSAPSAGDYSITDYLIEYKLSADSAWTLFPDGTSTTTSAIVTGLTNTSAYDFRVSAVSFAGAGTASATISRTPSATPTVPGIPTSLAGTGGSGQVALTWAAPANTGGSALTDYIIEYRALGSVSYSTFSDGTSTTAAATVTGLTNGTGYNFRVSAVNAVGTGSTSSVITVGAGSAIYRHILSTGQSLGEGVNSAPALSTTQPYSNKSLSTGPISGVSSPLIPLVEGVVARESPASGRANSLAAAMSGNPVIIDTIHALGGTGYSGIKKNGSTAAYANGQTQASVAKAQTTAAGAYYLPFGVTITHGETDAINNVSGSTYAGYMAEMQADYESDWNTLTGRSDTIPLFESQMNSNALGNIAVSQLTAHEDNPGKVILIGPKYSYAYESDHLHLSNTASKYLGEMFAKVMKKVLVDGSTWNPLMPVSVTRTGTTVLIDFAIPTGTLAIDTTNVAAHEDYGFEFTQTGGSAISITAVSLTDSNRKVSLTLSGVPDGTSPKIRYAWTCDAGSGNPAYATCGDPTNNGLVGGNIRDTDTSTSPSSAGTGLALYDWLVTFEKPITDTTYPEEPTALSGTPSSGQVALTWTEPVVDGGASISDYIVEYKAASSSTWSTFADGTSTTASATVTSLSNGTLYQFRVSAVNSIGRGDPSSVIYATSSGVSDAPTSLSATAGNTQVSLSWTAPASNGGSAITDYVVEYNSGSGWSTFADGTSASTSALVTGLSNGTSYTFRVSATNASGTSSTSSTASATPITTPGAPTSLGATAGNAQVALSWTAPVSNGGSALTDYVIEYKLAADSSWSTFSDGTSTSTSATVTSLSNGSSYNFRVYAVNAAGTGSASSTATATPVTTPGAPTSVTATTETSTSALVSWAAPASTGGTAITDYVVEYKLTADSSWSTFTDGTSTSTSATVTGLTEDTSYDFRISATNAVGTGSASSTASLTLSSSGRSIRVPPTVPTGLTATPGDARVVLSWRPPIANSPLSVTDYLIEYKFAVSSAWALFSDALSAATSAVVTGLENGTPYDFRVSAVNAVGIGPHSDSVRSSPATTTLPPQTQGGDILPPSDTPPPTQEFVSPVDGSTVSCTPPPFTASIKYGAKNNDRAEVKLWQAFLNKELGDTIPLTGYFGPRTLGAVKAFQNKYKNEILTPWNIKTPTGWVYQSTRFVANKLLGCPGSLILDNGKTIN